MKITLVAGYGTYYRPCCVCSKGFETGNTVAMAYVTQQWLGYVCSSCLSGGPEAIKATLRRRGEELLTLAERNIECPECEENQGG